MERSSLELAVLQAEVLYVHDASGKLLRINESDPDGPAPRFFLARTASGNLWRTRYDLPADLAARLEELASNEPIAGDLRQPPSYMADYQRLLEQHSPIKDRYAGPAYYLPLIDPPACAIMITPQNASLLQANFPYTLSTLPERSPAIAIVADDVPVSVCYSARSSVHAAEAGTYTIEEYRGRGYAAQGVRGWAAAVQATGRVALYSTWWENTASQAVASKIGAVLYAVEYSLT